MAHILLVTFAIRMLAIGQVLLIALVIARGDAPRQIRLSSALLLICTCAYLTLQTPLTDILHGPLWPIIPLGAQLVPLMLWVFANLLFERQLDRRVVAAGGVIAIGCWMVLGLGRIDDVAAPPTYLIVAATVQRIVQLVLLADAIRIALAERGDDLIEKRRRLRVGFVIVVAVQAVLVILLEFAFGFNNVPLPLAALQALAILAATSALGAALLQSDPDLLFDPARAKPPGTLSPADHVLKQKLDAAIAAGVYREPGLSIGVLADRLGMPEHRLRGLINQRLGYRNFSAFLNHHRIAEARRQLADPAHVTLPVLTIAMDLGYGSLAPFNRAFREDAGQSPSDFRRSQIVQK